MSHLMTSDMVPITSNTRFKKINSLCHLPRVILFRTEIHHVADFLASLLFSEHGAINILHILSKGELLKV